MSDTLIASLTATIPSSIVLDGQTLDMDQHSSSQSSGMGQSIGSSSSSSHVPIIATVCDLTTCFTTTLSRPKSSQSFFSISPTPSTSSASSQLVASLLPSNTSYSSPDQVYSPSEVTSDESDDDSVSPAAIPSVIAVIAFIVVAVLLLICIRKRRRKRREQRVALRLKGKTGSGISLPATPLSLSGGGNSHLGQGHYSQSSMSLTPSRLQSPLTPYSQVSVAPVELSHIRSTQAPLSSAGSGGGDGRLTVPVAAVSRPRPPPPPPPLRSQSPLPPPPPQPFTPPPLPPHMIPRERADTFSDLPHDELPPYVDPIEEAMTASAESEASTAPAPSRQPNPPPYHVVRIPEPAETRRDGL